MKPERMGNLLVALQFSMMTGLGLFALPELLGLRTSAGAWALLGAGAILGLWAVSTNRPGNFNIRPTPRAGGRLVTAGPYRWIRHPMYTAVLLLCAGCSWSVQSPWGWIAWALLAATLVIKSTLEERWMVQVHPGYAEYLARTSRFVPGIF